MKAPVAIHDWSVIERWFEKQATKSKDGYYGHIEHVRISPVFSKATLRAAENLAYALGQSIAEFINPKKKA